MVDVLQGLAVKESFQSPAANLSDLTMSFTLKTQSAVFFQQSSISEVETTKLLQRVTENGECTFDGWKLSLLVMPMIAAISFE